MQSFRSFFRLASYFHDDVLEVTLEVVDLLALVPGLFLFSHDPCALEFEDPMDGPTNTSWKLHPPALPNSGHD
jgi:hypothetical protein